LHSLLTLSQEGWDDHQVPPKSRSSAPPSPAKITFTQRQQAHAARVVGIIAPIVPVLAEALEPRTEVVLHDLTKMPNTIVAIGGSITGREVGGPATDLGLRNFSEGATEHMIGYRTQTDGGVSMRSSSIFFHASDQRPVVCLCFNTDVDDLERAQRIPSTLTGLAGTGPAASANDAPSTTESFPVSVETLSEGMMRDSIASVGIPVELMKKPHKMEVVAELDRRGFFTLREAADLAAKRLAVSRYTIYNYLNELSAGG
jgi:predicted transcriptional regulator YheO